MLAASPVRVRLVEDDERTLNLFCDALRIAGYAVDGVTTATAALDALAQRHHHIVVADNILPDIRAWTCSPPCAARCPRHHSFSTPAT